MLKNNIYNPETNTVFWNNVLNIPEFKVLCNTPQNQIWHKEGDVFTHTRMVTECMLNFIENNNKPLFTDCDYREILVFAALLHDIGKPIVTSKDENGIYHNKNHAIKSAEIAENILNTYAPELIMENQKAILSLIRQHMQPLYILTNNDSKKYILKIVNKVKYIDFESLLLLKYCDCKGSITDEYNPYTEILKEVRKLYYDVCSYLAGTKVYLHKLKDKNYKVHPNGINVGYKIEGRLSMPITVGYRTTLGLRFSTSPVIKVIDKNHFETINSIYEIFQVEN